MFKKYVNILMKKTKQYDKRAQNPFLKSEFSYNPFKSIYEQTYIWVEKTPESKDFQDSFSDETN